MSFIKDSIIISLIALAIVLPIRIFIFQPFLVNGDSMIPNFAHGDYLIVDELSYRFGDPARGDVIVFHPPNNSREDYIKRVIALPHDIVGIEEGIVYINGSPLDEPYIEDAPRYTLEEYEVPENNYFVLGDNRNHSNDSHNGWVLPRQNIIGKAWLSIWPPDEWGLVSNYSLNEQLEIPESK